MQVETDALKTLQEVEAFVNRHAGAAIKAPGRAAAYAQIGQVAGRFSYWQRSRAEKGLLRRYLQLTTGLSESQLTRLVGRYLREGELQDRRRGPARGFRRKYRLSDILLLAETDELHGTLSGPATRKLLERAWKVFGDSRYERLAQLSNGHLYNLRRHSSHERRMGSKTRTRPTTVAIGERRRPRPEGRPGYLRVDSVHQGDLGRVKGLYHVNVVDDVTQYEFVGTVERIAERFLLPVLERLLGAFPFEIRGFHSDNGSEYVNYQVAGLLDKLRIEEQTKSRARHCNDNALAESKNGNVIRRYPGYGHIPARHAARLHEFTFGVLSPYLNYHRPCYFPRERADSRGKVRKVYPYSDIQTPYEKLKGLPEAASRLRAGVSFEALDREACARTDNEAARELNAASDALFRELRQDAR